MTVSDRTAKRMTRALAALWIVGECIALADLAYAPDTPHWMWKVCVHLAFLVGAVVYVTVCD